MMGQQQQLHHLLQLPLRIDGHLISPSQRPPCQVLKSSNQDDAWPILSEKLKTFHIIVAQLVRVFIRNFKLLHCLQANLLNLLKSLIYLLIL